MIAITVTEYLLREHQIRAFKNVLNQCPACGEVTLFISNFNDECRCERPSCTWWAYYTFTGDGVPVFTTKSLNQVPSTGQPNTEMPSRGGR
jgi:hypothetical protein